MTSVSGETVAFPAGRIFLREVGTGPPVLLVNGLGAHTGMWSTLERTLTGMRLLEYDNPGAGASAVPWRPVSVKRLAELAVAVLDHFGVERADVLGYSMGGMITQELVTHAPERFRRVVLVATSPGVGGLQGDPLAMMSISTPLRYLSRNAYGATIGSLAGGRARHDHAWVETHGALRMQHPPTWRGYVGQMASLMPWSGLPLLERIPHPVLVVAGDDDPLTPLANAAIISHKIADARMLVCPGEGHLMLMDEDSAAQPAIRRFLSEEEPACWGTAAPVGAASVRDALARAPAQLPPWSVVNCLSRRHWLRLGPTPHGAP